MRTEEVFRVAPLEGDGSTHFVALVPAEIAVLARAFSAVRTEPTGYLVEALLISLSERGDPAWAQELAFDSEAEGCVVRSHRRPPLVFLMRRLERLVANPARLRARIRLVVGRD